MMASELRIEESKFAEIERIEPGIESISLFNSLGIEVDTAANDGA